MCGSEELRINAWLSYGACQYVRQPTGYRAFIPAPLPPLPPLNLSGEIAALLSTADRALGRLDGSVLTLPNPDLFGVHVCPQVGGAVQPDRGHASSLQDLLSAEAQCSIWGSPVTWTKS